MKMKKQNGIMTLKIYLNVELIKKMKLMYIILINLQEEIKIYFLITLKNVLNYLIQINILLL